MALIIADRVRDTSATTGTGTITVTGTAPTGFRAFASVMATSDTCWYAIVGGAEWEIGLGTLTGSLTLARTIVYSSSNANALVSFSAGTKDVYITAPASQLGGGVNADGLFTPLGSTTYAEEFSGALDGSWVQVDAAGTASRVTWTQGSGRLNVVHNGSGTDGSVTHLQLRPIGAALSAGDAIVTAFDVGVEAWAYNYIMSDLQFTDGTVSGTSNGIATQTYTNGSNGGYGIVRCNTNALLTGDGGASGPQTVINGGTMHSRLVMTAANTFRSDWSVDGVGWLKGNTTSYTLTPTHMGLGMSLWSGTTRSMVSFHYLRRFSGIT